jgi:hypothetical protein
MLISANQRASFYIHNDKSNFETSFGADLINLHFEQYNFIEWHQKATFMYIHTFITFSPKKKILVNVNIYIPMYIN